MNFDKRKKGNKTGLETMILKCHMILLDLIHISGSDCMSKVYHIKNFRIDPARSIGQCSFENIQQAILCQKRSRVYGAAKQHHQDVQYIMSHSLQIVPFR